MGGLQVTRSKKKLPADTAWPPTGGRDLKPDVPMRFPTLRDALEHKASQIIPTPPRPVALTEERAQDLLRNKSCGRVNTYLCRAYLQFGSAAMADKDLQRLSAAIEKFSKQQTP